MRSWIAHEVATASARVLRIAACFVYSRETSLWTRPAEEGKKMAMFRIVAGSVIIRCMLSMY